MNVSSLFTPFLTIVIFGRELTAKFNTPAICTVAKSFENKPELLRTHEQKSSVIFEDSLSRNGNKVLFSSLIHKHSWLQATKDSSPKPFGETLHTVRSVRM